MQVWKRRVAFVLAVGTGALGLTLSSAGAQTSPPDFPTFPSIPDFTFPTFPTIPPTAPPPTMPPPTMPPVTVTIPPPPTMPPVTVTIPPPPTMPPVTVTIPPPPTMPPITSPPSSIPSPDDFIEDLISRLEGFTEDPAFDELRQIVDAIIADFLD